EDGIRDATVTGVQTCALPIFHASGGNHRVVVQALRKLDELLIEAGNLLNGLIDLRRWLNARTQQANRGAEESFFCGDRKRPRARSEERRVGKECRSGWRGGE